MHYIYLKKRQMKYDLGANRAVFRDFLSGEDFSQRRQFLALLPSLSSPLSPPLVRDASLESWI